MKNTCVVRINDEHEAHFRSGYGVADIGSWPQRLEKKFRGAGVYSIRCVLKSSPESVRVDIIGATRNDWDDIPAIFDESKYGICSRFLHELGVNPPPEGKHKTLYLIVTKRRL